MKSNKFYFLPFLDNFIAILISILFTAFFGSWTSFRPFGIFMATALTLTMCGLIYSRMWKLSRKSERYGFGIKFSDGIKYVLPLAIVSAIIVLIYFLSETGVLPFREMILKTYYVFPDNLPREAVNVTVFDRINTVARFWFFYLTDFSENTSSLILATGPVLMILSAALGMKLGKDDKEFLNGYLTVTKKIKDKFNE